MTTLDYVTVSAGLAGCVLANRLTADGPSTVLLLAGTSSGDELAQALSRHRRALSRRLRAQGTTFQKVLDEVRFEVARQLLERSRTPIDEVAVALCYGDVSAFMHAFRRWTGTAAAQWRKVADRP